MQTDWRIEAKLYCGFTFFQLLFSVQKASKASEAHHKKEEYVFPSELKELRLLEDSHISLTSFKTDLNETCRVKDVSHVCLNNKTRKDESPRRLPLVPSFPATTSIPQQTPSFNTRSLSDYFIRTVFKFNRLYTKFVQNMHLKTAANAVWTSPGSPKSTKNNIAYPLSGTCPYKSRQLSRCLAKSEIYGINLTQIHRLHFILEKLWCCQPTSKSE